MRPAHSRVGCCGQQSGWPCGCAHAAAPAQTPLPVTRRPGTPFGGLWAGAHGCQRRQERAAALSLGHQKYAQRSQAVAALVVLSSLPVQAASQVACDCAGRWHTGRFGRQGVWRSCGSSRPPRADTCCLDKRRTSCLQKCVLCAARTAEVRLPCPSALWCAWALLSLSADFLTGCKALKVCIKSCAAVRTGLILLWCQGPQKPA